MRKPALNKINYRDQSESSPGLEVERDILQVRRVVAGNPNTPRQVLIRLAVDESDTIRRAVAINPRTPKEILRDLALDPH